MKVITLFILLFTLVYANDIAYSFHLNNHTPYQNEAILLDVNITQEEHSRVMLFKFNPKKSEAYTFHQISFKENDKYHHLKHQYRYLIYPKEVGRCSLEFEMIKSLTDDDKVAYAISGDRDNVKGLVKKDIHIQLEPLTLEVKALPKGTDIVGDFRLNYTLDKSSTDAYDPVHLHVVLTGKGSLSPLLLIPKSAQYHLFTQAPKVKSVHTFKGTQTDMVWDYAISAKEDFRLPEVLLKGFNPQTQKRYDLKIPAQTIEVKKVDATTLIDSEDNPAATREYDWSWLWMLFSYLMVFVAGYLMPKNLFKRKMISEKSKEELLKEKIVNAKTHKELLKLLLSENRLAYREAIAHLERVVYNKKRISLDKIKKILE